MSIKTVGTRFNDVLFGVDDPKRDYHDNINGKEGNDLLFGGLSRDNLRGGAGDDILVGGPGDDVLNGDGFGAGHGEGAGPGRDTFLFNRGDGYDVIRDFHVGEDRIVFDGIDESELTFSVSWSNKSPHHWGAGGLKGWVTTVSYDGGHVDVVGVQAHSLADLNG